MVIEPLLARSFARLRFSHLTPPLPFPTYLTSLSYVSYLFFEKKIKNKEKIGQSINRTARKKTG